jgi:uncharacterized protein YaiI (UPF0178 family)
VEYVVDGMNVVGTRADGWWRDRPSARRRLVAELAVLAEASGVTVFFDGRPAPDEIAGVVDGVVVRFAPGGPNAADDAIVEHLAAGPIPHDLVIVTSDGALARRVTALGVTVVGARSFLSDLSLRRSQT